MQALSFVRGIGAVAVRYGLEESILLDTIMFWVRENRSRGENRRDGRWWTYNSIRGLEEIFPWWSGKQLRRILNSCREQGALLVGSYNQDGRDRTVWYSPGDELLRLYGEEVPAGDPGEPSEQRAQTGDCICPNGQMHVPERADASAQMGEPLPCLNPCNKLIPPIVPQGDGGGGKQPPAKKPRGRGKRTAYEPEWFERLWQLYPRQDAKEDARRAWDKLRPSRELCREMSMGLARQAASPKWQEEGGRYIPLLSTWLNGRRWRDQGVVLPAGAPAAPPQAGGSAWAPDPEVTG